MLAEDPLTLMPPHRYPLTPPPYSNPHIFPSLALSRCSTPYRFYLRAIAHAPLLLRPSILDSTGTAPSPIQLPLRSLTPPPFATPPADTFYGLNTHLPLRSPFLPPTPRRITHRERATQNESPALRIAPPIGAPLSNCCVTPLLLAPPLLSPRALTLVSVQWCTPPL